MNLIDFKRLAAQNLGACLQQLSEKLDARHKDIENAMLGFEARLHRLDAGKRNGVISLDEWDLGMNRLVHDVLGFLDTLREEHFSPLARLREEIHEKILVVCDNEAAIQKMDAFFDSFYFKNVDYALHQYDEDKIAWCDLIVFDYLYARQENPAFYDLLVQYLNYAPRYLLYFGRNNKILENFPMKAYFANSPFSLYARLREILEFMKYYKGEGSEIRGS
jgi:hypothetical protein